MDSGFVFTVFIDFRPCSCVCVAVGALGDEFFLDLFGKRERQGEREYFASTGEYGTVRSVSCSGTQISLGSIYPGDTFIKVGK